MVGTKDKIYEVVPSCLKLGCVVGRHRLPFIHANPMGYALLNNSTLYQRYYVHIQYPY